MSSTEKLNIKTHLTVNPQSREHGQHTHDWKRGEPTGKLASRGSANQ
jgi:hypothetical protein